MPQDREKDYTGAGFGITAAVTAILIVVMFIPGQRVGSTVIKRANILSDIIDMGPDPAPAAPAVPAAYDFDEELIAMAESTLPVTPAKTETAPEPGSETAPAATETVVPAPAEETAAGQPSSPAPQPTQEEYVYTATEEPVITAEMSESEAESMAGGPVVAIEDFGSDEGISMDGFYRALATQSDRRPVRIAVLGDSFIEGDIFVADVREQLQKLYSGRGVGFIPFASDVSQFRATMKYTHSGWKTYTTLHAKSLPEDIKGRFFVSCLLAEAEEGARSHFEGNYFRKNIKRADIATLLFTNEKGSTINVTVNDSIRSSFTPDTSPEPQSLTLEGKIEKLDVEIENPEGFYGYGVAFDGRTGVCVDNYSLRGNSGLALFGTTYDMNSRMNRLRGFDLIILEYGLNVISADVTEYGYYRSHLKRIIDFLKACYPDTSILVMGIADRSTQQNGEFVTMPGVEPMIATQRRAARECGVAFWNTYEAMGGNGSMARFVENGWAAKDYTHIGFGGGKRIATSLVRAIVAGKTGYQQRPVVKKEPQTDLSQYEIQ